VNETYFMLDPRESCSICHHVSRVYLRTRAERGICWLVAVRETKGGFHISQHEFGNHYNPAILAAKGTLVFLNALLLAEELDYSKLPFDIRDSLRDVGLKIPVSAEEVRQGR